MIKLLENKTNDWRKRNKALQQLPIITKDYKKEEIINLFSNKGLCKNLCVQLSERRSQVIKESCLCIKSMALAHPGSISLYAPDFFPALFLCVRMNVQIISKSGMTAIANVVRHADEDSDFNILNSCVKGLDEKHDSVREVLFYSTADYIRKTIR
eukprot:UN26299